MKHTVCTTLTILHKIVGKTKKNQFNSIESAPDKNKTRTRKEVNLIMFSTVTFLSSGDFAALPFTVFCPDENTIRGLVESAVLVVFSIDVSFVAFLSSATKLKSIPPLPPLLRCRLLAFAAGAGVNVLRWDFIISGVNRFTGLM